MSTRKPYDQNSKIIAIIGGGVSGSLTAYHLLLQEVGARVIVIDPRPELGLGLAYSTPSLRHLLNVPAGKISALPHQPDHFLLWLQTNYDAAATASMFAPRAVFGRYIQSLLAGLDGLEQVQASVVDYRAADSGAILTLSAGQKLWADRVVLAMGNFDPAQLPGISEAAQRNGTYCHNAWLAETYQDLPVDAPVALIGTGLTGVDVVLRLRELGHRGTITAVSRHGVFPNRHASYLPMTAPAIPKGTTPTCVAYLRALRSAIAHGAEWRAAIDSLRADTNHLWMSLPTKEQKRFRRHLQRRWDVVRHRMAPSIADLIDVELEAGILTLREGHLMAVTTTSDGALITLRTPHGTEELVAMRVINCTGPIMNYRRVDSLLLQGLFQQGLLVSGSLGGGLVSDAAGALIAQDGTASQVLFNVGPGRLGVLLESIAIPELRQQAFDLAAHLVDGLATVHAVAREQALETGELVAA